ncbi:hypothetical protein [Sphingomonas gellani]|nr:hypothetical protein [Sphingomonas gellani]
MLARLREERFLLFSEQELIDAGLPYEWRKSTKDWMLIEIAKNPLTPIQTPRMPAEVSSYLDWVRMYQRESASHNNRLRNMLEREKDLLARDAARGTFDPPLSAEEREVLRMGRFHREMLWEYRESGVKGLNSVPDEQWVWLGEVPPVIRWACDLPLEAPYPFNQWAPNLPPHKVRQITMFEWAVQACTDRFGPQVCEPGP